MRDVIVRTTIRELAGAEADACSRSQTNRFARPSAKEIIESRRVKSLSFCHVRAQLIRRDNTQTRRQRILHKVRLLLYFIDDVLFSLWNRASTIGTSAYVPLLLRPPN